MKYIRVISTVLIAFALYSSCTSSFNPAAPYKAITVAYGLLNLTDTIHYIKIEKTFLSENGGNAYTEAAVADSLYYPAGTINASLQAINSNGSLVATLPLKDTTGPTKQPGVFATTPNIVYYTRTPLNANYTYNLIINNNKTGQVTTSQTGIVDSFLITSPGRYQTVIFYTQNNNYFDASWNASPNAVLYQLVIRFHYSEINKSNPNDSTVNLVTWVFPTQNYTYIPGSSNLVTVGFPGLGFYQFAAAEIPVNDLVKRRALSFDFWVYAGGLQLYTYQLVSVANSTSLVEGITNPTYSDISNGVGLFSSVFLQTNNGLVVDPTTIDTLACSSVTSQLGFMNRYGQLCNQ